MSACVIPTPIDPAYLDGDWTDRFQFVDERCAPEDWTGCAVDLVGSRRRVGVLDDGDIISLTSAAGQIGLDVADCIITPRVPQATVSSWRPGLWDFSLRRLLPNGAIDLALKFQLPVISGPRQAGDDSDFGSNALSGEGGVTVMASDGGWRIVRGGGAPGRNAVTGFGFSITGLLGPSEILPGFRGDGLTPIAGAFSRVTALRPATQDTTIDLLLIGAGATLDAAEVIGSVVFAADATEGEITLPYTTPPDGAVFCPRGPAIPDPTLDLLFFNFKGN